MSTIVVNNQTPVLVGLSGSHIELESFRMWLVDDVSRICLDGGVSACGLVIMFPASALMVVFLHLP